MEISPQGAYDHLADLAPFRAYLASRTDEQWNLDTVRSADGEKNCFYGHLFNYGEKCVLDTGGSPEQAEKFANWLWDMFEELWATTYRVYPVNDGKNPDYQQATPRLRCLAFLDALVSGEEENTGQSMDRQYQFYLDSLAKDDAAAKTDA